MADQQLMERCIRECLEFADVASRCVNEYLGSEQATSPPPSSGRPPPDRHPP